MDWTLLSGTELADAIFCLPPAVDNYARLRCLEVERAGARALLLAEIGENQLRPQKEPPEWMTSGKPGVDLYLPLDQSLCLLLADKVSRDRPLTAINLVASRRRPNRKESSQPKLLREREFTPQELSALSKLRGPALADAILLSRHAGERAGERAGLESDFELALARLRDLTIENGRVKIQPPSWADAAGRAQPCLLLTLPADQLALPLTPEKDGRFQAVATTLLSEKWALKDLAECPLPGGLRVSKQLEVSPEELENLRLAWEREGPRLILQDGRRAALRPADETQRAAGCRWIATRWA